MHIGQILHVIEDHTAAALPAIVTAVRGDIVDLEKFGVAAVNKLLSDVIVAGSEAEARVEGAGEHNTHVAFVPESTPAAAPAEPVPAEPVRVPAV